MTNLYRLNVSLTKHNAHKVARLIRDYDIDEVVARLEEVRADRAQARKNLSVGAADALPPVWQKAKTVGADAVDALVLVGIIFSHWELIRAVANASDRQGFTGRIDRAQPLDGKAYTNFARVIDQLGYATKLEHRGVTFSLKGMFEIPGLGPLVAELLELKLTGAGWDRSNDLLDEVERLEFQKVFGITGDELRAWLSAGAQPEAAASTLLLKDQEFFESPTEGLAAKKFEFKPGHTPREVEAIDKAGSPRSRVNRLHNDIQNRLYDHLKERLGAANVATELDTGSGTAIDVATLHKGKTTFYEIKTSGSVRASIRQALPQLLEYAYWPSDSRADELVVVSHLPLTADAERYLRLLREKFGLPVSYRQFDLKTNKLA